MNSLKNAWFLLKSKLATLEVNGSLLGDSKSMMIAYLFSAKKLSLSKRIGTVTFTL